MKIALTTALVLCAGNFGQGLASVYIVDHDFTLTLPGTPVLGWAKWTYSETALAAGNPPASASDGGAEIVEFPSGDTRWVTASASAGNAFATARYNLAGSASVVYGQVHVDGMALDTSGSSSSSEISARFGSTDGHGHIDWNEHWSISSDASGNATGTDPVHVDAGGRSTDLVRIDSSISAGSISWQDGLINLSGRDGYVRVGMDSSVITSGFGELVLEFADGRVTRVEDSGVFDGLLPLKNR